MKHNIDPSVTFSRLALRLALTYSLACTGLITASSYAQTIYKWVDASGSTHYGYRAPQNAKKTSKVVTYNDQSSTVPANHQAEVPVTNQPPNTPQPMATPPQSTEPSLAAPQPVVPDRQYPQQADSNLSSL